MRRDIDLVGFGGGRAAPPTYMKMLVQRGQTLVAHFDAHRLYAVQAGDGGFVQRGVIYPPSRAMRPNPDAVSKLAPEEHVARHPERLGLGVEQRILDGAEPLGDHAASGRPDKAI